MATRSTFAEVTIVDLTDADVYRTIYLYQNKSGTAPTLPADTAGFTSSTGAPANTGSWTTTASTPANGETIYVATMTLVQTMGTGNFVSSSGWSRSVGGIRVDGTNGVDGEPGPRFSSRRLYTNPAVDSAPSAPSATITWSTGALSSITSGWSETPPAIVATSNLSIYHSDLFFADTTGDATTTTDTGNTPIQGINFSGLVTFSDGDFSTGGNTITTIDGGNITTGSIRGGNAAYNNTNDAWSGTGFRLSVGNNDITDLNEGAFFVGDSSGGYLAYDGTSFTFNGSVNFSNVNGAGNLANSNATLGNLATVNAVNISNQVNGAGNLATANSVNAENQVNSLNAGNVSGLGNLATDNTTLGNLASNNSVNVTNEVNGTGNLATANTVNITNQVNGTGNLATANAVNTGQVTGAGNLISANAVNVTNQVNGINQNSLITANTAANARSAIGAGTGNGNGNGNSNLTNANVSINAAKVNDFTGTVQNTNINGGFINTGVVAGGNLTIDSTNFEPNAGQGFALGTSSGTGRFVVGSASEYMWWDGSTLNVQGEIRNIGPTTLTAQEGGPFHAISASETLTNNLDGAGTYVFAMVGGGGGGVEIDRDDYSVANGGAAGGCAIFSFEWDGNTALSFSRGNGGSRAAAAVAGAGNASNFTYGSTVIATANGGGGGLRSSGTASGGSASFSNNFGNNVGPGFLATYARNGGNTSGSSAAGGGAGVDFFGDGGGDVIGNSPNLATAGGSMWFDSVTGMSSSTNTEVRKVMGQGPGFSSEALGTSNNTFNTSHIGIIGGFGKTFALSDGNGTGHNAGNGGIFCGGGGAHTNSNSVVKSGSGGVGGGGAGCKSDGGRTAGNGGTGALFWSKL